LSSSVLFLTLAKKWSMISKFTDFCEGQVKKGDIINQIKFIEELFAIVA